MRPLPLAAVLAVALYVFVSWSEYIYGDEFKEWVVGAVVEGP